MHRKDEGSGAAARDGPVTTGARSDPPSTNEAPVWRDGEAPTARDEELEGISEEIELSLSRERPATPMPSGGDPKLVEVIRELSGDLPDGDEDLAGNSGDAWDANDDSAPG